MSFFPSFFLSRFLAVSLHTELKNTIKLFLSSNKTGSNNKLHFQQPETFFDQKISKNLKKKCHGTYLVFCFLLIAPWGLLVSWGCWCLAGGVKMARNKTGQKIPIPLKATDRLCPFFFFRGPLGARKAANSLSS
jgi:hypothetical protein